MFAYGLSEHLRQCLTHIVAHIPPLLRAIQGSFPTSSSPCGLLRLLVSQSDYSISYRLF
jgi:hypothetical protein